MEMILVAGAGKTVFLSGITVSGWLPTPCAHGDTTWTHWVMKKMKERLLSG